MLQKSFLENDSGYLLPGNQMLEMTWAVVSTGSFYDGCNQSSVVYRRGITYANSTHKFSM